MSILVEPTVLARTSDRTDAELLCIRLGARGVASRVKRVRDAGILEFARHHVEHFVVLVSAADVKLATEELAAWTAQSQRARAEDLRPGSDARAHPW